MTTRYSALLGILLCSLAVAHLEAQQPAVVAGTITDSSGGILPGATIEALRGLRVVSATTTGHDGRYLLDLPADGSYRVTARLDGFAAGATDLTADAEATADFQLDIAPLSDTVVVTASRTAEGRASVMESHSVFTEDDIETLGSHSGGGRSALRAGPQRRVDRPGRPAHVGLRARRRVRLQPCADRRRARERQRRRLRLRPCLGQRDRAGRGRAGRAVGALRLGCDGLRHPDLHQAGDTGQRPATVRLHRGRLVRNRTRRPSSARRGPAARRLPARRGLPRNRRRVSGPPRRARPLRSAIHRRQRRRDCRRQHQAADRVPLQQRPRQLDRSYHVRAGRHRLRLRHGRPDVAPRLRPDALLTHRPFRDGELLPVRTSVRGRLRRSAIPRLRAPRRHARRALSGRAAARTAARPDGIRRAGGGPVRRGRGPVPRAERPVQRLRLPLRVRGGVAPPGCAVPAQRHLARQPGVERRLRLLQRDQCARRAADRGEPLLLRAAAVQRRRRVVRHRRDAHRRQRPLRDLGQSETVRGRVSPPVPGGPALVAQGIGQRRPRDQESELLAPVRLAVRRRRPVPAAGAGGHGGRGRRAHVRRPALAGAGHLVQQRLREPDGASTSAADGRQGLSG